MGSRRETPISCATSGRPPIDKTGHAFAVDGDRPAASASTRGPQGRGGIAVAGPPVRHGSGSPVAPTGRPGSLRPPSAPKGPDPVPGRPQLRLERGAVEPGDEVGPPSSPSRATTRAGGTGASSWQSGGSVTTGRSRASSSPTSRSSTSRPPTTRRRPRVARSSARPWPSSTGPPTTSTGSSRPCER